MESVHLPLPHRTRQHSDVPSANDVTAALATFPAILHARARPHPPLIDQQSQAPPLTRDVRDMLSRIADGSQTLDTDAVEFVRLWMSSSLPFVVEGTWNSVLDAISGKENATSSSTASAVSGGVGRALGLLGRITGGGRSRALSNVNAASITSTPPTGAVPGRKDSADGAFAAPPSTSAMSGLDAPDIRLESHVLTFEPSAAAGQVSATNLGPRAPGAAAGSSASASPYTASSAPPAADAPPYVTLGDVAPAGVQLEASSTGDASPAVPCPLHVTLRLPLALSNWGKHKALVSARPLTAFPSGGDAYLAVTPQSLVLRRGEAGALSVTLQLLRPDANVAALLVIESSTGVGGAAGSVQLVLVRACAEFACFGVRIEDVPAVARHAGYARIPLPLALLREALVVVSAEQMAPLLDTEGIFRVAPAALDVLEIRRVLSGATRAGAAAATAAAATAAAATAAGAGGCALDSNTVSRLCRCGALAVAHAIKLWLRELPMPLLSSIPVEALLAAAGEDAYVAVAARYLPDTPRRVFAWLVDLLLLVAAREEANKMSAKALAICVAPNLFAGDVAANPMLALMVGQKVVALLTAVLTVRRRGV